MSAPPVPAAALAAACVDEWARLAARRPLPASDDVAGDAAHRLLLVDVFAGTERAGVRGRLGGARAAACVTALAGAARRERAAVAVACAAVLADEDPAQLVAVRAALAPADADAAPGAFPRFAAGERVPVALAEGRFAEMADALAASAAAPVRSLWLVAPPSAGALPWAALRPLLALERADLLLAFPAADVHRHERFAGTPFADLPGHLRRTVAGVSVLLGDERHAWLGTWRAATASGGAAEAEARLAEAWAARIRGAAPGRAVKRLELAAPGGAGGALHLLLVSADPGLPLAMNGVVRALGLRDAAAERAPRVAPPAADPRVLELFADAEMGPAEPDEAERPVDAAALADRIAASCRGATAAYGDVLRALAATDVAAEDVRRAMALLKRQGRARFRSLADTCAEVEFPAEPAPPVRRTPVARPLALAADTDAGPLFAPPARPVTPLRGSAGETSLSTEDRADRDRPDATTIGGEEDRASGGDADAGGAGSGAATPDASTGGRPPRKEGARRRRGPRDQPSGS
jgi:hypothetical protein